MNSRNGISPRRCLAHVSASAVVSVVVSIALSIMPKASVHAASVASFELVTHYEVDGNAEIVQAFGDGQYLVHTNSDLETIDVLDIRSPAKPALVDSFSMPGEPTSVGVSPDGKWAMAVVYTAKSKAKRKPKDPRLPGVLALLDLRDPLKPSIVAMLGIGHHPDSIAVAARGKKLYGVVAIENEPLIVIDGKVMDSDKPGHPNDISQRGGVQIIEIDPLKPEQYAITNVVLPEALLAENAFLHPADPQPEYIAIPKSHAKKSSRLAAVSLQENNGVVLINPFTGKINDAFSLGVVADRPADLKADGRAALNQRYPSDALSQQPVAGARCPDAIAFSPDGSYILSADEGDLPLTGGRGFSIWSLGGELVWDDGGEIERRAAQMGMYPDERSDVRGIEVEGIAAASIKGKDYAFALSERGSFVAVYDIDAPAKPELLQLVATEVGPESATVIAERGLVVIAAETGKALTILRATYP